MNAHASTSFSSSPNEYSNRNPTELRNDIEASREALTDTIKRLDDRMHRAVDWRAQVRDHPMIAISAAAVGGILVAGLFRHKPTPRERIVDAIAESVEDITDRLRNRIGSKLTRTVTGSLLKSAITAAVAKAATDYLLHINANDLNSNNSET